MAPLSGTGALAGVAPVVAAALLAAITGGLLAERPHLARWLVGIPIVVIAVVSAAAYPRAAAMVTLAGLPFLGLLRHLFIPITGLPAFDPLLAVPMIMVAVVFVRVIVMERRRVTGGTISLLVTVLASLCLLQVINPLGGGIAAGLLSLVSTLVFLLWFWVGREVLRARDISRLLWIFVIEANVIALYGLSQSSNGFLPWDQAWLDAGGLRSLSVGDALRPFGTFSSASEYVTFLAVGAVAALGLAISRGRWSGLLAIPLPVIAVALSGVRSTLIAVVVGLIVVGALSTRRPGAAIAAFATLVAVVLAAFGLAQPYLAATQNSTQNALVGHTLSGLLDPWAKNSTGPVHVQMVVDGVQAGFAQPLGRGASSVTLAGQKTGTASSFGNTEFDFSNAFVAFGLVGGITFLVLAFTTLWRAWRQALHRTSAASLAVAGILTCTAGAWWGAAAWATAPIFWMLIGSVARSAGEAKAGTNAPGVAA